MIRIKKPLKKYTMENVFRMCYFYFSIPFTLTPNWKQVTQIQVKVYYEWIGSGMARITCTEFSEMQWMYVRDMLELASQVQAAARNNSRSVATGSSQYPHDEEQEEARRQ